MSAAIVMDVGTRCQVTIANKMFVTLLLLSLRNFHVTHHVTMFMFQVVHFQVVHFQVVHFQLFIQVGGVIDEICHPTDDWWITVSGDNFLFSYC